MHSRIVNLVVWHSVFGATAFASSQQSRSKHFVWKPFLATPLAMEAEQLRQLLATQAEQHAAQMRELRELVAQTVQLANTAVNAAGQAAAQAAVTAAATPAPSPSPPRASAEIASIVDPKAIEKLTTFDGKGSPFH